MSARLAIAVKPGSKRPGIELDGDAITVRVAERAIDGRANEACLRAMAEALGLAPSALRLIRGAHHRSKVVEVDGLTAEEALLRLR